MLKFLPPKAFIFKLGNSLNLSLDLFTLVQKGRLEKNRKGPVLQPQLYNLVRLFNAKPHLQSVHRRLLWFVETKPQHFDILK